MPQDITGNDQLTTAEVDVDFSDALRHLRAGHRVTRRGWSRSRAHSLTLWAPDEGEGASGGSPVTVPFLVIWTKAGPVGPWTPPHCDLLATDWYVVPAAPVE